MNILTIILNSALAVTIVSIILSIFYELLLRTSKRYNYQRKNPLVAFTAIGTPETDFIYRHSRTRNFFIITAIINFILSGVLGIIIALL